MLLLLRLSFVDLYVAYYAYSFDGCIVVLFLIYEQMIGVMEVILLVVVVQVNLPLL